MKKNEFEKMKTRTVVDLQKEVLEQKEKLWNAQREIHDGKLKNVHSAKAIKRTIARLHTAISAQKAQPTKK